MIAFAPFGRPAHRAGRRVERHELPFRLFDMPYSVPSATTGALMYIVTSGFFHACVACQCTARRCVQRERLRALPDAADDQMRAGPHRRDDVLVPLVGKRNRPERRAAPRVDAHDRLIGQRDDLAHAADA